ncbi:MAG: hypothetical protein KAI79_11040 [Bacteroidales bacterium]|nr:hypothetical protein [Bacteroidales bacterium]
MSYSDDYLSDKEVYALVPGSQVLRKSLALKVIENIDKVDPPLDMRWIKKKGAIILVKRYVIALDYYFKPDLVYLPLAKEFELLNMKIDSSLSQLMGDIEENISQTNYLDYYEEFGIKKITNIYYDTEQYGIPDDYEGRVQFMMNLLKVFEKYYLQNLPNGSKYWEGLLNQYLQIFNGKTRNEHLIIRSIGQRNFLYKRVGIFLVALIHMTLGQNPDNWRELLISYGYNIAEKAEK